MAHVDVFPGAELPGLTRRTGAFMDGWKLRKVEFTDNRVRVSDALDRVSYLSDPVGALENYAVQSVQCLRSATTGLLIIILGGFTVGSKTQQSLMLSTDYPVAEPITFEQYQKGAR